MSFREIRTFTETMRLLGYARTISVESFKNPNIELVADVLYWLVRRYEPSADIAYVIDTEQDRIFFFRRICELILAKSRIRLNIKKLYQADGYAVQEMLKLANVLKDAGKARMEDDSDYTSLQSQASQKGHQDAKKVRQLCADITHQGSNLFFLVEQETKNRANRTRTLSRATEVGEFERRLRDLLSKVSSQVETLQTSLSNQQADETNLEHKIEGKRTQLERNQKRLKSLMNVHPAFMEEYERYEADLHTQFVTYLEQYRNLEYLEHQLAKYNGVEDELLKEQETKLRVMRERLRKEELKVLRNEAVEEDSDDEDEGGGAAGPGASEAARKAASFNQNRHDSSRGADGTKRPRVASGRQRPRPDGEGGAAGQPGAAAGGAAAAGPSTTANPLGDVKRPRGTGMAYGDDTESDDSDSDDDSDDSDDDSDDEGGLGSNMRAAGRGGVSNGDALGIDDDSDGDDDDDDDSDVSDDDSDDDDDSDGSDDDDSGSDSD